MKTRNVIGIIKIFGVLALSICLHSILSGQERTVGAISLESESSQEGYNLFFPHFQPDVFLVDRCGRVMHRWEDDADFTPGNIAYIGENGNLYKAKKPSDPPNLTFGAGGAGGIVEVRDWDNQLLWTRTWMDTVYRQHHDLAVLPNGNFLVNAWERFVGDSVVVKGADPMVWVSDDIWSEVIYEIDYVNDTIVWEWHAWDHTIQDYDNTRDNFGVVADHPEKIHLNYLANTTGRADWLHFNSIDYNPALDQILISVPHYDEIWIIDHSTTSEEAAGSSGGNSGKGGDLIYRWGNPEAYDRGTDDDRQLFFEHDANWIDDFVSTDHPYRNLISIFNNRVEDSLSIAIVIDPAFDSGNNEYPNDANMHFSPATPTLSIVHMDSIKMYSSGLSSFQVLDNGNFLICSGRNGYTFEIDEQQNLHWEYKTPFNRGADIDQGTVLEVNQNITFKVKRYPTDYTGFNQLVVPNDPQPLELNNPGDFCSLLTPVVTLPISKTIVLAPNPVQTNLEISNLQGKGDHLRIFNLLGHLVHHQRIFDSKLSLDVSQMDNGMYIIHLENENIVGRFVINR